MSTDKLPAEDYSELASTSNAPRRPLNLLRHPSGRPVHVAGSPEALEGLRKQLTKDHGEDGFDVYIRGSKEHLKALEDIKQHHETRRAELKATHGTVYDEFEAVHSELDKLSEELHGLAAHGQAVSLNANFDRYGYNAHIRARADDSEMSRSNSISAASTDEERRQGEALPFWKKPVVRQYWHKGLIWRSSASEEVAPYELFVDTLYVGVIEILAERASEDPTGRGLLRFTVTFILSWKLWSDLTMVISWFESDDIFQRICILVFMSCLVGYTTNIEHAFDSTYTELISFYLAERFFQAIYFLFIAVMVPMMRGALVGSTVTILIGAALWIGSIHVDWPERFALIWIAIPWDVFSVGFVLPIVTSSKYMENTRLHFLTKYFQFYPALNIEHKTERTNAFVTLVFGYSVVALLYQSAAGEGINAYYGKAILGLIIAFSFNMFYFEIDGANLYTHAIRRSKYAYMVWQYIHLPFILSYILASSALAKLVIAHDSINSPTEALAHEDEVGSEGEINDGLRWFFCAGLGLSLACMSIISLTHEHKTIMDGVRITKMHRISFRFAMSIILICLPLATELSSLELVATATGLVLAALIVDLWGSNCRRDSFWFDKGRCRYAADCKLGKKDLEAMHRGEVTDLEDLVKRQKGEKGGLDLTT